MSKLDIDGWDPVDLAKFRPQHYAPRFAIKANEEDTSFHQTRGYHRYLKKERREGRLEIGDSGLLLLVHDEIGDSWPSLRRGWVKVKISQFSEQLNVSERAASTRINRLLESGHLQRRQRSAVEEPVQPRTSRRGYVYRAAFPWKQDPQDVRREKRERIRETVRKRLEETQIHTDGREAQEEHDDQQSDRSERESEQEKEIDAEHLDGLSEEAAETAQDLYQQYAPQS